MGSYGSTFAGSGATWPPFTPQPRFCFPLWSAEETQAGSGPWLELGSVHLTSEGALWACQWSPTPEEAPSPELATPWVLVSRFVAR